MDENTVSLSPCVQVTKCGTRRGASPTIQRGIEARWSVGAQKSGAWGSIFLVPLLCGLGFCVGVFAVGFVFVFFVGEDVADEGADEDDRVCQCPPVYQGHWEGYALREVDQRP